MNPLVVICDTARGGGGRGGRLLALSTCRITNTACCWKHTWDRPVDIYSYVNTSRWAPPRYTGVLYMTETRGAASWKPGGHEEHEEHETWLTLHFKDQSVKTHLHAAAGGSELDVFSPSFSYKHIHCLCLLWLVSVLLISLILEEEQGSINRAGSEVFKLLMWRQSKSLVLVL